MLAPDGVFAQVPAVVAPQNDNRVIPLATFVQPGQNTTDLCIGVADTRGVVFSDSCRELGVIVRISLPTVVLHELARTVPSSLPLWLQGMRSRWQNRVLVTLHVLSRCAERQVRANDADGQEEWFRFVSRQLFKLGE